MGNGNSNSKQAKVEENPRQVQEQQPVLSTGINENPVRNRTSDERRHQRRRGSRKQYIQLGTIRLSIVSGDITEQMTDVVVNSAVPDLNLNKGQASKALLNAAGQAIQDECNKNYPSGIKSTDVAITGPGNMKCKTIYHVTVPTYRNAGDEKNLETVTQNCLQQATRRGMTSISFPALGTGFRKYNPQVAVSTLLKTVENFSKNATNSSLKQINCVVFENDTFKVFLKEAKDRAMSKGETTIVTIPPTTTQIGNINISLTVGSLVNEQADVIVCSCAKSMKLSQRKGIAKALSEEAGSGLQAEIDQKYQNGINIGDLAVTGGYNLKCNKVYFGSLTPFYAKRENGCLPEKVLYNFVKQCLEEASNHSIKSIAFPALGSGFLKFPAKSAASHVSKAIKDFQAENTISSIHHIKIVVYGGAKDWKSIQEAYQSILSEPEPSAQAPIVNRIPARGTKDYLSYKYNEDPRTPAYWTHFNSTKTIKEWNTSTIGGHCKTVQVDSTTFQNISNAFQKSTNGSFSIISIERLENIYLFEQYIQECQRTFRKAFVDEPCNPLDKVPTSSGTAFTSNHLGNMTNHLHNEINEFYLFHGTKVEYVDAVFQQGLDNRLASSGLLGTGVYAAEKAEKSLGYTNTNDNGERKMFLMRMNLGDIFIAKSSYKYKRPPCKTCGIDTCTEHLELFDSIVAEFKFREFVVYDKSKCYPEYIITFQ